MMAAPVAPVAPVAPEACEGTLYWQHLCSGELLQLITKRSQILGLAPDLIFDGLDFFEGFDSGGWLLGCGVRGVVCGKKERIRDSQPEYSLAIFKRA